MKSPFHFGIIAVWLGAVGTLLSSSAPMAQETQAYPAKQVHIVIPYGPGGLSDTLTRAIAQKLTEKWGQPVVVDNRPGASGNIGSEYVARSTPDGYTLLVAEGSVFTVNPALYSKQGFNPIQDFAPITMLVSYGQVLVVHPSVPTRTVKEFVALVKAKPGALTYGSYGNGSGAHLNMERFKRIHELDILHVPFKGATPAITELLAGRISVVFVTTALSASHIKAGRLRALAIATQKHSPLLPEVPTFAEAGFPGFEATSWFGMVAPAGAPQAIISKVHDDVIRIIGDPDFKEQRFTKLGVDAVGNSPEEFAAYLRSESSAMAKLIRDIGAKVD